MERRKITLIPRTLRVLRGNVLLIVAAAYVLAVYVYPIAVLGLLSLSDPAALRLFWSSSVYATVLGRTFLFAAEVTFITLVVSFPLAYAAATGGARMRALVLLMSTIPLWTSALVRSYAWLLVLNRRGLINTILQFLGLSPLEMSHNTTGTLIGSVYVTLPVTVLFLYAGIRSIDPNKIRAARTLGARPLQAFLHIYLPQSLPSIVTSTLLIFLTALGFYITPTILGGQKDFLFSMLIAQQLEHSGDFPGAAALSVIFLLAAAIFLAIFGIIGGFGQLMGGAPQGHSWRTIGPSYRFGRLIASLGPLANLFESRAFLRAYVWAAIVFIMLPFAIIVPASLSPASYLEFPPQQISWHWYAEIAADETWTRAAQASLEVGVLATVLATGVGLLGALGLRRADRFKGQLAIALFLAPMLVPTMIYAVGSYYVAAGVSAVDTVWGIGLAHSVLGLPFAVVVISAGLSGIDRFAEPAARSLGAGPTRAFLRVTLPLTLPAIIIAAVVAFQTSFDEVIVSLFLSGVQTRTIPKQLWQGATLEVDPSITAVAVVILAIVLLVVVAGFALVRAVSTWQSSSTIR